MTPPVPPRGQLFSEGLDSVCTLLVGRTISSGYPAIRTWRRSTTLSFPGRRGKRLPPRMDAKKGKTRKESTPIKVWVTPEEKAAIAAKADAHSLSASSYLRRLGLAMPVESTIDQRAILDLVKINADLGPVRRTHQNVVNHECGFAIAQRAGFAAQTGEHVDRCARSPEKDE